MIELADRPISRRLVDVFCLAVAYFVAAKVAVMLAIPPGYSTAVWPAAGIALAGVLILGNHAAIGILIGSLLTNAPTSLDTTSAASIVHSLIPAVGIALGAPLQALFGAFLARRFVGFPNPLIEEQAILKFLILGGPVSCLVSTTIGNASLYLSGVISLFNLAFSWWTWWVGDTIGCLIFAPLVIIWTSKPTKVWRHRQISVTLPLILTFSLAVMLFIFASSSEQNRIKLDFETRAESLARAQTMNFDGYLDALESIQGFYASTPSVDRHAFHTFVSHFLATHSGAQAIEWAPLVPAGERRAIEARARAAGVPGFRIYEMDSHGRTVPAGNREEYVPVYYVEPVMGNETALGYDLASGGTRRAALAIARDTGRPTGSAAITLVQDKGHEAGFLIVLPIYEFERPHGTLAARLHYLRGYVVGVFRVGDMTQAAGHGLDRTGIRTRLFDDTDRNSKTLLYDDGGDQYGPAHTAAGERLSANALNKSVEFPVAGRMWRLQFSETEEYLTTHKSWQAWTVLAAGLLFTGLLGALLLVVTGRTIRIEYVVAERTAELRNTNEHLHLNIVERTKAEQMLSQQAEALARSNDDLEQFAYAASHDLQEPLRKIQTFGSRLQEKYHGVLGTEGVDYLNRMQGAAVRMQTLIEDLLALSQVTTQAQPFVPIDLTQAASEVLGDLETQIERTGGRVRIDSLPTIEGDPLQIRQLFQNLIGNALKYHRVGVPPQVEVRAAARNSGYVEIVVEDNGIGFDNQFVERIFAPFQRLHSRSEYQGSGMGLAICRKIVEHHRGTITAAGRPGDGATFTVVLPTQRQN